MKTDQQLPKQESNVNASHKTHSVLFLFGTLEVGGSEKKFVMLANRLANSGYDVHVAYLSSPESLLPELRGVPSVHLHRKGKWSFGALRRLVRLIDQEEITTVVTVNTYPLLYALPARRLAKIQTVRVVASINTSSFGTRRDRRFMHLYKRLLRYCDWVVFGSVSQQDSWVDEFGIRRERSVVVHNGVDGNYFDPDRVDDESDEIRLGLGIPADAPIIVCVGQLRPEKAHEMLVNAIAALHAERRFLTHLILVGEGERRQSILALAQELGIREYVHLVGVVQDVRPFLVAANLFALTSTAVETFSNAALEAYAMGLPVVISDIGGAREMFPPGSSGTVYSANCAVELITALRSGLMDSEVGKSNRSTIRSEALGRFSIDRMDADWIKAIWNDSPEKHA